MYRTGNFTRAFNCINEAKKNESAQVMLELAKLHSRKGDKLVALKELQKSIPIHFPQVRKWIFPKITITINSDSDLSRSPNNKISSEEEKSRKLCSQSLLLQAQLNDELHILDIEKNIKNYKDCITVFNNSEKNYFHLAEYHDRLLTNPDQKSTQSYVRFIIYIKT
jgi:hypothetical protein